MKKSEITVIWKEAMPLIAHEVVSEAKKIRRRSTTLVETKMTVADTDNILNDDFWEPAVALLHQMLKRTER